MKKIITLLLLLITTMSCYAPKHNTLQRKEDLEFLERLKLERKKQIFENRKRIIVLSTILKEKPYNKFQAERAYKREGVKGLLQVSAIMVTACNRIAGFTKFYLSDRTDSIKSVEMYYTFMDKHNPDYDFQKAAYLWNGGEGYQNATMEQKERLEKYWESLKLIIQRIESKS